MLWLQLTYSPHPPSHLFENRKSFCYWTSQIHAYRYLKSYYCPSLTGCPCDCRQIWSDQVHESVLSDATKVADDLRVFTVLSRTSTRFTNGWSCSAINFCCKTIFGCYFWRHIKVSKFPFNFYSRHDME